MHSLGCVSLQKKGQNVLKSHSSFGMFLFWFCFPFFHFNVLISCQRQLSEFWHRHIHSFSLFLYQHSLFTTPLSECHSHLSLTHRLPLHLPGERCPSFSHDRSVPRRFELHILPLFKVTDCCMPNSPL